jgi:2-polyprenyl-6-methoxyphenol hydroxylase-like FAD-dependent oxidoreductase
MREIHVPCCVVGGGPAGMMLGFLLARAGVGVMVLEKHGDFLRDFRGDTVHPSTLELMHELGLFDDFLQRPHEKLERLGGQIGQTNVWIGDFRYLPTRAKFIVFMPQWDFLNFLVDKARAYPEFQLGMRHEAVDLVQESGTVTGVRVKTPDGELIVRADLVVGTDGRHSIVREKAGLHVLDKGAPMDVLWMRISRHQDDPEQSFGHVESGKIFVTIHRGDYWQCAFVIPKGSAEQLKACGLENFREQIVQLVPYFRDRVGEIKSWDDVKLLTVKVDRLEKWYKPGLLCIGDAAHAMSPIGGVGINLAVQDAVAAANILAAPLAQRKRLLPFLDQVQSRREFPTRVTQAVQITAQNRVIGPLLQSSKPLKAPFILKLLQQFPVLQRLPARAVGIGVRAEHVKTADAHRQR